MLYPTAQDWLSTTGRKVMLFGMSGLGKTHVSTMLRERAGWFHYSVDYRIGTRYMGEHILDSYKEEAMKSPVLRDLLLSDSIHIASKITFHNLAPLSTYMGKPGDPARGGLAIGEYRRRQALHRDAEVAAMLDTPHFISRARRLYGYEHFVCDTSGSICEVVDPDDPEDAVMSALAPHLLPVWIRGTEEQAEELAARFDRAPPPMYYRPEMLERFWTDFLSETGTGDATADPDAFARFSYRRALAARLPRYAAIAARWGVTVEAAEVAALRSPEDFMALVARALDRRASA
ncbi:MAG: ATPase [Rhodobacteraceae bacterium]|nr:ATPase [Paracoccaceae bacterium]